MDRRSPFAFAIVCAFAFLAVTSRSSLAATIVVTPTSQPPNTLLSSSNAAIDGVQPRDGAGSVDFAPDNSFMVLEYGSLSGGSFGTWGDLTSVAWDALAPAGAFTPTLALRLNYFGESDTFFVAFNPVVATGGWQTIALDKSAGFIQEAENSGYVPVTIADDTIISGIHLRGSFQDFQVFADLPTLVFGQDSLTLNFEPLAAPVPEPASALLLGLGVAGLAARRRFRDVAN